VDIRLEGGWTSGLMTSGDQAQIDGSSGAASLGQRVASRDAIRQALQATTAASRMSIGGTTMPLGPRSSGGSRPIRASSARRWTAPDQVDFEARIGAVTG
jgi:hypothetical protein